MLIENYSGRESTLAGKKKGKLSYSDGKLLRREKHSGGQK